MVDGSGQILLTALSTDEERLLVVPKDRCLSELSASGTIEKASTFGDVRKDRAAWAQVEPEIDDYLRRLYEYGELEDDPSATVIRRRYTSASAPFDADSFFADEDQSWRADAFLSTEQWLIQTEPELFDVFRNSDAGWGISYTPSTFVPAAARDPFERLLMRLGYRVMHLHDLHDLYLNPPAGRRAVLARLRSAKPIRRPRHGS